jgi:hypothetical protein
MQRSADHPLRTGAKVDLSGMHVTVASETADHRPKEVLVRFDVPLEDPELTFVCWTRDGYAPFNVPAVGKSVILPAMNFLSLHIWKRPDAGAHGG